MKYFKNALVSCTIVAASTAVAKKNDTYFVRSVRHLDDSNDWDDRNGVDSNDVNDWDDRNDTVSNDWDDRNDVDSKDGNGRDDLNDDSTDVNGAGTRTKNGAAAATIHSIGFGLVGAVSVAMAMEALM